MVVLQLERELSEWLLNPLFSETVFQERMITMMIMVVLSGVVVLYARIRKTALSRFPGAFWEEIHPYQLRLRCIAGQYSRKLYRWVSSDSAVALRQYRHPYFLRN